MVQHNRVIEPSGGTTTSWRRMMILTFSSGAIRLSPSVASDNFASTPGHGVQLTAERFWPGMKEPIFSDPLQSFRPDPANNFDGQHGLMNIIAQGCSKSSKIILVFCGEAIFLL